MAQLCIDELEEARETWNFIGHFNEKKEHDKKKKMRKANE